MNDWELFEAMNEAERRFNELQAEFRKRGLHNKPFAEYSHAAQQSVHLTASGAGGRGDNPLQSSFIADDPSAKIGGR